MKFKQKKLRMRKNNHQLKLRVLRSLKRRNIAHFYKLDD